MRLRHDEDIMHVLVAAALFTAPFWETKAPHEWSKQELRKMVEDSPWAQIAEAPRRGLAPGVQVYLASATPVREAEAELARRGNVPSDLLREEYEAFLREAGGKSIVLAIYVPDASRVAEGEEARRMQEDSVLKTGRQSLRMTGHFPPTSSDPFLRLIFPRPQTAGGNRLTFEIYVPGIPAPYRSVEFRLKDLTYKGKPDY
jgi:hypothetical protein